MEHLFSGTVFSPRFFQALCWTLVHSLWQGLVAALLAGLVILCTRRSSPSLRYKLLLSVLAAYLLTTTGTFYLQYEQAGKHISSLTVLDASQKREFNLSPADRTANTATIQSLPFSGSFTSYLNEHAWAIVLLWFFFFLFKCIQLFSGLRYIHRIRYQKNEQVTGEWMERLYELSGRMGMRQTLVFLESQLVKVPVVIGWLKPAILVPAGLLTNLPASQVEAILLHELAHIRRMDFLVNFLQSLAEMIFFFNPSILWISDCIREEREACCDDVVLTCLPGKGSYLEALISFQEYNLVSPSFALGLGGNKNYLLNRVKRMLTQENKKLNVMEKIILTSGLAALMAFGLMPKQKTTTHATKNVSSQLSGKTNDNKRKALGLASYLASSNTDTVPKERKATPPGRSFPSISSNVQDNGRSRTSVIEATDEQGKKYRIKKLNDEIISLSVNGVEVPKEQFGTYRDVIAAIEQEQLVRSEKSQKEQEARRGLQEEKLKDIQLQKEMLMEEQERKHKEMIRDYDNKRREMEETRERQSREADEALNAFVEKQRSTQLKNEQETVRLRDSLRGLQELQEKAVRDFRESQESNEEIVQIIQDLLRHDLITETDPLSFTLNNRELLVNGKKQPPEMHQQFKNRYLHRPGDELIYSRKGGTKTITINKD